MYGFFWKCCAEPFPEDRYRGDPYFLRDEKKQDDMRHEFQTKMPEVADKSAFILVMSEIYNLLKVLCTA